MKRVTSTIAFAVAVGAWPLAANADNAFTLRDVDVYTGPGSEYPPVASLAPNTSVDVAGCLSDWSWCDVFVADLRGWVYAGDLGYPYENRRVAIIEVGPRVRLPVVAFSLPAYWDAHYRGRPWYRERDVWVNRVHAQVEHGGRPPEGRAARTASPSGGTTPPQERAQTQTQVQTPPQGQAQTPQPTYTQPREPRPTDRAASPQPSQPSPQSTPPSPAQPPQAAPGARENAQQPRQATQPPSTQSVPQGGARSPDARPPENRPPEIRPPDNRPPENRPPEGRGPETRPPTARGPEGRGPEQQGEREGGPPPGRGEREGKGPQGQGRGGENDRNQPQNDRNQPQ